MTVLRFGTGWRDRHGRERSLLWAGELGWLLWDDGRDVDIVRRGLTDQVTLECRLLGWEDQVDDPGGPEWVTRQVCYWAPPIPHPDCMVCQGEGYYAGAEGVAVRCGCEQVF